MFAEHQRQPKRRLVVGYRRVNARTLRAVYYIRRADDVKAEVAGRVLMTFWTLLPALTESSIRLELGRCWRLSLVAVSFCPSV